MNKTQELLDQAGVLLLNHMKELDRFSERDYYLIRFGTTIKTLRKTMALLDMARLGYVTQAVRRMGELTGGSARRAYYTLRRVSRLLGEPLHPHPQNQNEDQNDDANADEIQ